MEEEVCLKSRHYEIGLSIKNCRSNKKKALQCLEESFWMCAGQYVSQKWGIIDAY